MSKLNFNRWVYEPIPWWTNGSQTHSWASDLQSTNCECSTWYWRRLVKDNTREWQRGSLLQRDSRLGGHWIHREHRVVQVHSQWKQKETMLEKTTAPDCSHRSCTLRTASHPVSFNHRPSRKQQQAKLSLSTGHSPCWYRTKWSGQTGRQQTVITTACQQFLLNARNKESVSASARQPKSLQANPIKMGQIMLDFFFPSQSTFLFDHSNNLTSCVCVCVCERACGACRVYFRVWAKQNYETRVRSYIMLWLQFVVLVFNR